MPKSKQSVKEKIKKKLPSAQRIKMLVSQLVPAVNNNSRALRDYQELLKQHIIILSLVQRKLGVTPNELQEETRRIVDESKGRFEKRSLQSEEVGTDEDRSGDGQPGVLDAESSGVDPVSSDAVEADGDGGAVCSVEPDEGDTASSPS